MADKTVNIWVKIKGNAEKSLKGINSTLSVTDKKAQKAAVSFKSMAVAAGGLVAIHKANQWMRENTRLAKQQQLATARLTSIAKLVTKATDEQVLALQRLADEQQNVTAIGDEVTEAGLSQILSYGTTAKQAELLTESLGDLMAANDGLETTQEGAINAANMFGKALSGQAGALSRAGILMDERQTKLIQEGDQATRVNTLIEVMSANYGGLAKSLAQTDAGKIKQAENAINDLREEVGEKLLPALVDVKDAQKTFYEFILNNEGAIVSSVSAIANGISAVTQALDWMLFKQEASNEQWEAFNVAQKSLANSKKFLDRNTEARDNLNKKMRDGVALTEDEAIRLSFLGDLIKDDIATRDEAIKKMNELSGAMDAGSVSLSTQTRLLVDNTKETEDNADAKAKAAEEAGKAHEANMSAFGKAFATQQENAHKVRTLDEEVRQEELAAQEIADASNKTRAEDRMQMALDIASATAQGMQTILGAVSNSRQQEHDNEVRQRKEDVKSSTLSAKQKAKALEKIEAQASKDRLKLRLSEWRQAIAMSIVNTAVAVAGALPNIPKSIAVGALGLASTVAVIANKPKFYNGGEAHSMTGMRGDVIPTLKREGELTLTPSETDAYKKGKGGVAQITYAPQLNFNGPVDESVLPTIEEMIKASEVGVARVIEDMFTNGTMNAENINGALAL